MGSSESRFLGFSPRKRVRQSQRHSPTWVLAPCQELSHSRMGIRACSCPRGRFGASQDRTNLSPLLSPAAKQHWCLQACGITLPVSLCPKAGSWGMNNLPEPLSFLLVCSMQAAPHFISLWLLSLRLSWRRGVLGLAEQNCWVPGSPQQEWWWLILGGTTTFVLEIFTLL